MLTTIAKVKKILLLDESDTSLDDTLQLYILAASQAIANYCRRDFKKQSYTDITHSAPGSKLLVLRNYPIDSVEEVTIPSGTITDFDVITDGLLYRDAGWPDEVRSVTVKYTAGYVLSDEATSDNPCTLPEPLELACVQLTKMFFNDQILKESERLGDYSVRYLTANAEHSLPPAVISLISPYVGRWV